MKLRLNVFVLLTAFFGYLVGVMAVGSGWDLGVAMTLVHTLVGTAAAAFGASVFNQLMEIREDSRMRRTANRPLPSARMLPTSAFVLGWVLSAFGIIHLGAMVGKDAAYLAGITIATYVFIYTPMKRRTSANTLVGAIPGALPPLIGWVAEVCWPISLGRPAARNIGRQGPWGVCAWANREARNRVVICPSS